MMIKSFKNDTVSANVVCLLIRQITDQVVKTSWFAVVQGPSYQLHSLLMLYSAMIIVINTVFILGKVGGLCTLPADHHLLMYCKLSVF
jgi:hypothetical protein